MQGVITRVQVLAHPIVIVESFGVKVLLRAIFASARETFLDVVSRCAEEEAHATMQDLDLADTVRRFIDLECQVGEVYRALSRRFANDPGAATFFRTLWAHEQGHAVVLARVRREIRRGHLWKDSREVHLTDVAALEEALGGYAREVARGPTLARALELVEAIEGSELNVVFDTLRGCVDMRSRSRFERFFVLTERHLAYCREQVQRLRAEHGIALASASGA